MSNVTVLKKFENGGMKVRVQAGPDIGGADPVDLTLSPSGKQLRVSWASDWEVLHELRHDGLLSRTFDKYTYGHQEFFATPKLLEELKA